MGYERLIPAGGGNPYSNHPGFDAQECREQIVVTKRNPRPLEVKESR